MRQVFVMIFAIGFSSVSWAADFDSSKDIECAVSVASYNEMKSFTLGAVDSDGRRSLKENSGKEHVGACVEIVDRIRCQVFHGLTEYRFDLLSKNLSVSEETKNSGLAIKKTFVEAGEGSCSQK
ncbi:MAG: hypothetical protein KF789_14200 [Bdellovibrionaceae bacterium]|nr:hypothetical protein [Pseudobdellovibrionaceae bacterium]